MTHAVPRSLRTPLIDQLADDPDSIDLERTRAALLEAVKAGRGDEYLPIAGQSAGLINDVLPASEIVRRTAAEADAILRAWTRALA